MREAPGPFKLAEAEPPAAELLLLPASEPWFRVFLRNLSDLFRQPVSNPPLESAPAAFWSDVFVDRALPWRRFLQSAAGHVLLLALLWAGSRFLALQPHATVRPEFAHADVVYYTPSQYLPPLDTRPPTSIRARKPDPEYSAQPIISLPPEPTNRSQTVVTPPRLQLQHDVALPNAVSWSDKPQLPIGPVPAVPASEITRLAPQIDRSIISPPPAMQNQPQASSRQTLQAPQPSVIAPPPSVEAGSTRRVGDLNIARSSVIAPAPQLALDAQRTLSPRNTSMGKRTPDVIAPPPALAASGRSRSGGSMIALNLHPTVGAPPVAPAGNRRGSFAATPEGHRGASGEPGTTAGGKDSATGSGSGKKNSSDLPSGLYVGKTTNSTSPTVNPNLIAGVRPPRVSTHAQPAAENKLSEEERTVFGDRKIYSLSLNMPNLNSAGGSWIIRFAPLNRDLSPGALAARAATAADPSSTDPSATDLAAPSATRKVDPAYPLELMKQNVGGTVILYAVIHADGTVGSVRVLRSIDLRLDQFASQAIAKWQFQPATKNGQPVEVEATFWIPFHPARTNSNF